jgi:hypothetical protein
MKAKAAANTTIPKLAAFASPALGMAGMLVDVGPTGVLVSPPVGCTILVPFVWVTTVDGGSGVVSQVVMVVTGTLSHVKIVTVTVASSVGPVGSAVCVIVVAVGSSVVVVGSAVSVTVVAVGSSVVVVGSAVSVTVVAVGSSVVVVGSAVSVTVVAVGSSVVVVGSAVSVTVVGSGVGVQTSPGRGNVPSRLPEPP